MQEKQYDDGLDKAFDDRMAVATEELRKKNVEHRKELDKIEDSVTVKDLDNLPQLLKDTLLVQARMVIACISTKPKEKLECLGQLRMKGFTQQDAREQVALLLSEMKEEI